MGEKRAWLRAFELRAATAAERAGEANWGTQVREGRGRAGILNETDWSCRGEGDEVAGLSTRGGMSNAISRRGRMKGLGGYGRGDESDGCERAMGGMRQWWWRGGWGGGGDSGIRREGRGNKFGDGQPHTRGQTYLFM